MYSSKEKLSIDNQSDIDNQDNISLNLNSTHSDVNSPIRSYALIETNSDELDHIIDLLRQFFPKTKIIEYNNQSHSLHETTSQQQTSIELNYNSHFLISTKSSFDNDINNDQVSSNTNSQIFKGKVKNYLQRRYLEQINEHQSHKEKIFTKYSNDNINSFNLSSSSTNNKPSINLKSHSFDSSSSLLQHSIKTENLPIIHSQNKRDLLEHCETLDIDETSNDTEKQTFSIDQPDDDDDDEQQTNNFLIPYQHSSEQEQDKITSSYPSGIQLPLTPYSVSSDPGPFNSPWFNTPTSHFNFRFPQSQEQIVTNAEGSIAQLSTLTKILCDEPSVFTPITPRFKTKKYNLNTSKNSSSILSCQICREEFDSHQMYLIHYRTHLENNKSDILNCDHTNNLRNYSCNICSKRFSRSDMLNRHSRLHSGIRPYRCTMCNTHFSRSDHLSTHLRTHTGEKPYTCPLCSYTACRRDMITRHLKIHTKQRVKRKNATSTFASSNDS